jgi:hypothetical protein
MRKDPLIACAIGFRPTALVTPYLGRVPSRDIKKFDQGFALDPRGKAVKIKV